MVFGACQIPLTTFSCILHLTLFRPLEEETALGIYFFFFLLTEREKDKKKGKLQPEFAFNQYDVMIVTQSLPLVAIKITIMQ